MRLKNLVAILACLATPAWLHGGETPLSREGQQRAANRQARAKVREDYAAAHAKAQASYLNLMASLCQWLISKQDKTDAKNIIKELEGIDSQFVKLPELRQGAAGIAVSKPLEEGAQKEWAARLKSARQEKAKGLMELASICYRAGLFGLAYDLVWEILDADPDNQTVRAAVGYVKAGDTWQSQYAASQLQKQNKYLPGLGWVPAAAVEKALNGEWLDNNRLVPLEEADKAHSSSANPWIIETENFILKSTATRQQAIAIAEHLENIRALCFRQYLAFFMRGSSKRGTQLLFNQAAPQKCWCGTTAARTISRPLLRKK